jgi:PKD repeat protein
MRGILALAIAAACGCVHETGGPGGGGGGGGGGTSGLTAGYSLTPTSPKAGEAASFNGSSSTGSPTSYTWSWGDGTADTSGVEPTALHTFAAPGSYKVVLTVSKPGNCPPIGLLCSASTEKTVTVVLGGPPPPVAGYHVDSGASCVENFGLAVCQAQTGAEVTMTSTSVGTVDSLAWDFGDGQTASGATAVHRFLRAGDYSIRLTATGNGQSSQSVKSFVVSGPSISDSALVLSWFQRSHGALEQTSDFYVYNPGADPLELSVTYLKRGTPSSTPPQKNLVIAPRATLFVADALKNLFSIDEGSGFLYFKWTGITAQPVITGTNNTKLADGTTFGQSFAAVRVPRTTPGLPAATAVADQSLVGLSDVSGQSFSTFGVSNPFDAPAQIELQFTNAAGAPLRGNVPLTIARNGQVLYQIVDIRALGVQNQDNYRITIKGISGGPVIPFAKKLREGSQDQAFVPAVKNEKAKVILLGTYSGDTVRGNRWSTDAVLYNPTENVLDVDAQFVPVGVSSTPSPIATFHLQPRASRRLVDILKNEWDTQNVNGYITFETKNGGSGPYAGVLGEIYDYANPKKVYGNVFSALSDDNAAGAGQSLALIGLMQNASYNTTLWIYNPGPGPAQAELVYRASSDGRELARTITGQPAGVMRLVNPKGFPAAVQGLTEPFTVEMKVNFGNMIASGLMVSSATGDPTYVVGVAH